MLKQNPTIVFPKPRKVEIEDRPIPEPHSGDLLIKTRRSLISIGTELTVFSGDFPPNSAWSDMAQFPFVPGYSNVGVVADVGVGVDAAWIGRRVCTYGPHATYTVCKADHARMIQHDSITDEAGVFFTIAEIVMNGVRRSNLRWGESVGIFGLGLLGQLTARIALLAGALPVIAFDVSERRLQWLDLHPSLSTVRTDRSDPILVSRKLTRQRMVDVVFEVTGNASLIPREFGVLHPQGRFVILSSPRGETTFDFHDLCNAPSHTIIGALNFSHPEHATIDNPWTYQRDAELFFDLLAHERLEILSLVSHRAPYTDAISWYPRLLEDRSDTMGVVFEWPD